MPWGQSDSLPPTDYNSQMYNYGATGHVDGGSAMPWAAVAAPAAASVVGSLIGAHSASNANKQQAQSDAAVLQFEREKEAERRREWDLTVAAQKAQWEQRQAQLAPYNQLRASIAAKYGVKIPMSATEYKPPVMPTDWKPGDPVPAGGPDVAARQETVTAGVPLTSGGFQSTAPIRSSVTPQLNLGNIHDWSGSIWGGLRG